jgi:hypothetical protein
MSVSRRWVVNLLREIGHPEAADSAARELPDPVEMDQVKEFGDKHGITRDELVSRMGGSP